jgi:hypothetical protein
VQVCLMVAGTMSPSLSLQLEGQFLLFLCLIRSIALVSLLILLSICDGTALQFAYLVSEMIFSRSSLLDVSIRGMTGTS